MPIYGAVVLYNMWIVVKVIKIHTKIKNKRIVEKAAVVYLDKHSRYVVDKIYKIENERIHLM